MHNLDLYSVLKLRPTAVGGVISGPDGVVLGQRPASAVYQAGLWQLPPAGSLDDGMARDDGTVDFARQLLAELREEVGLTAEDVQVLGPLCLVEHAGSHVLDLGMGMTTRLDAAAILAAHRGASHAEYATLHVVPREALGGFLAERRESVTPQALVFLARMGLATG